MGCNEFYIVMCRTTEPLHVTIRIRYGNTIDILFVPGEFIWREARAFVLCLPSSVPPSLLIVHPKVPQWNDDTMTCFNVIFDDDSIGHILYLPAAFVAATHLESIRVDEEITLSGDNYTIAHTHLVVEEGLPQTAYVGLATR